MEQYITISTSSGFEIPGVLNKKTNSNKIIILVHGLTGSMSEAHYYAAKEYFIEKGYEVFRFNLYAGKSENRNLHECCIADHAIDISKVLKHFFSLYKDIYLAGHSLAGPSIIRCDWFPDNLRKIVFWDPAFDTSGTILRCIEKSGEYFFDPRNGKLVQISQEMYRELQENIHMTMLENMSFPINKTSIIFAGNCDKVKFKSETDSMGISSTIIDGANHGFTQEGKYKELFDTTLKFIES